MAARHKILAVGISLLLFLGLVQGKKGNLASYKCRNLREEQLPKQAQMGNLFDMTKFTVRFSHGKIRNLFELRLSNVI